MEYNEIINLREKLKKCPSVLEELESLATSAIFCPSKEIRNIAINSIINKYNKIIGVFMGDNQVMLELQHNNGEFKLGYLCEAPKGSLRELIPYPFRIG